MSTVRGSGGSGQQLHRAQLERRLDGAFGVCLTSVTAPAGFGKSTLLTSWTADVEAIWYAATPRDAALATFARGLATAVRARVPQLEEAPFVAGGTGDELSRADALAGLLCETLEGRVSHDVILVIDDLHELDGAAAATRFVEGVCRQAPANVHLVLASREVVPFPVQRLRGQGRLLELTGADLAFAPGEIAELLGGVDAQLAIAVHAATGGWPALVRLTIDALAGLPADDRAAALERLPQAEEAMLAYLFEEVFAREPVRVRELLRTTALLDSFSPELCVALGVPDAERTMADLRRRGFFLEPRDGGFALHGLIRRSALRIWPWPDAEARAVQRAAGLWLESQGQVEDGLRMLATAEAHTELAAALARHGPGLLAAGVVDGVARSYEAVPKGLRDGALDLLAGEALAIMGEYDRALDVLRGRTEEARSVPTGLAWRLVQAHFLLDDLQDAVDAYARAEPGSGDTADEGLLLAWTANAQLRRGESTTARELAARALRAATASGDDRALAAAHLAAALVAAPDANPQHRDQHLAAAAAAADRAGDVLQAARVRNAVGSTLIEECRYRAAITELDGAVRLAEVIGFPAVRALALMNRGLARWCMGELDAAGADYEAAAAVYRRIGSREACYAIIGLGDVHRERGNLALARAAYEEGLNLAERSGDVQGVVPGLYQFAKVLVDDEPERAREAADQAIAYGWPDRSWALNAGGWIALAHADHERAREAVDLAATEATRQRDRYGLAESFELKALCAASSAEREPLLHEALAIWTDLGNGLHQAAVELALARLAPGREGRDLAERAKRKLGRLGVRISSRGPAGLLRFVADDPPVPVAIDALGGFRVRRHGEPVQHEAWQSKKSRDLLKMLVARRGQPAPRDLLMEALWPDQDPERLRNRLAVAVSTLRSVLDPDKRFDGEHFVRSSGGSVALDLDHVAVDLERFLRAAAAGLADHARTGDVAQLEVAEALYGGDVLAEDPYEDWAVAPREEARVAYIRVARALAAGAAARGDHGAATSYLLRILQHDAFDERAHLDLVAAHSAAGAHGAARNSYRAYVQRMQVIGVEPSPFSPALDPAGKPDVPRDPVRSRWSQSDRSDRTRDLCGGSSSS